jgi:ring-1,2-phenylacetyl-CoA epoxidase subunit PaaC
VGRRRLGPRGADGACEKKRAAGWRRSETGRSDPFQNEDLAGVFENSAPPLGHGRAHAHDKSTEWPLWEVFIRGQHGISHRHVGSLHAPDAEMAMKNARDVYTRRNEGVSIWVVEARHITASSPSDKGPLYEPSQSKVYRHPTFFDIPDDVGAHVMWVSSTPTDAAEASDLFEFLCRMGDNTLILGHRVSEWCGHAPVLEEDIALANTALDLIGQTQMWLGLAGEVEGQGRSADDLAFLRDVWDFRNLLLVEQPNGDFGHTMMRQFLYDAWHVLPMLERLTDSTDDRIADIAAKAVKETAYHVERSGDTVIGLGDGTPESHARMQAALDRLWPYVARCSISDEVDAAMAAARVAPDPEACAQPGAMDRMQAVLTEATLNRAGSPAMPSSAASPARVP